MRILSITQALPPNVLGGYEIGAAQMSTELAARGHEVLILTSGDCSGFEIPARLEVDASLQSVPVYQAHIRDVLPKSSKRDLFFKGRGFHADNLEIVHRTIERFDPDLVLLWNPLSLGGMSIPVLCSMVGVPVYWVLADDVPVTSAKYGQSDFAGVLDVLNHTFDGYYISKTRNLVHELLSRGLRPSRPIQILQSWQYVPFEPDSYDARVPDYRPGEPLRCIVNSIVSVEKGLHVIVDAVSSLTDQERSLIDVQWYGRLVDENAWSKVLGSTARDNISLLGGVKIEDLAKKCSQHHVCLFPTWEREPFGIAPLDAALYDCVPIISNRCGVAEWLVDGQDCIKIKRSAQQLAACLRQILSGEIDLRPVRNGLSQRVRDRFSLDRSASVFERFLVRTLETRTTRRKQRTKHSIASVLDVARSILPFYVHKLR